MPQINEYREVSIFWHRIGYKMVEL